MKKKKYVLMIFTYDNHLNTNMIYYMAMTKFDGYMKYINSEKNYNNMIINPLTFLDDTPYFQVFSINPKNKVPNSTLKLYVMDINRAYKFMVEPDLYIANKNNKYEAKLFIRLINDFAVYPFFKTSVNSLNEIKLNFNSSCSNIWECSSIYNLDSFVECIEKTTRFFNDDPYYIFNRFNHIALTKLFEDNQNLINKAGLSFNDLKNIVTYNTLNKDHFDKTIFGDDGIFKDYFNHYNPLIDLKNTNSMNNEVKVEPTQEKNLNEIEDYSKIVDTKYKELCKNCFPIINTLIKTSIDSFKSSVDITIDDLKDYVEIKPDDSYDSSLEPYYVWHTKRMIPVMRYLARYYDKKKGLTASLSVADTCMTISWLY